MPKALRLLFAALLLAAPLAAPIVAHAQGDTRVYEMRTYTAAPGRLDDLAKALGARPRAGVVFAGTVSEAAAVDGDRGPRMLIEILSYANAAGAGRDLAAVQAGAAWKTAQRTGPLLDGAPVSTLLRAADFSPPSPLSPQGAHVYELRRYNTGAAGLDRTVREFRQGLARIIAGAGMTPIAYWTTDGGDAFVYLLAHKDRDAAKASWAAFMTPFRPFVAQFNADNPAPPGPRTPDDNRFLTPTAYSPRR